MNDGICFMFNPYDYSGHYGLQLLEIIYDALKKMKYTGKVTIYSGDNVKRSYSHYDIGVLLNSGKPNNFWQNISDSIESNKAKDIRYIGYSCAYRASLKESYLLFQGTFLFFDGIPIKLLDDDPIDTWTLFGCIIDDEDTPIVLRRHLDELRDGR